MSFLTSLKQNKSSWILLVTLFIFDNLFSYYAVTKLGGKEANFLIASWVEKYPILYFACIPIQIGILYGIEQLLVKILTFVFRHTIDFEKIVLKALALYWIIGNSSMNISFLVGYRQSSETWYLLSAVAFLTAMGYVLATVKPWKQVR